MLLAQISEGGDIKQLYDELFTEDGSETRLQSIDLYFDSFPQPKTLWWLSPRMSLSHRDSR